MSTVTKICSFKKNCTPDWEQVQLFLRMITHEKVCFSYLQSVKKKKKRNVSYLFQYKLSYKNEIGSNHHGLLFTSVYALKFFLGVGIIANARI